MRQARHNRSNLPARSHCRVNDQIVKLRQSILAIKDAPIHRRTQLATDALGQLLEILENIDRRLIQLEGS